MRTASRNLADTRMGRLVLTHARSPGGVRAIFVVVGAMLGLLAGFFYYLASPVQYNSSATFVLAPVSLASAQSSGGGGGIGSALSLLGGSGFSEPDIYLAQIKSHDFMERFLARHPEIVTGYREYFSANSFPRDPRNIPPETVDMLRQGYIQVVPTSSSRIFQLTVSGPKPEFAAYVARQLLVSMNAMISDGATAEHQARLNYLRAQLSTAANVLLRDSISGLATEEIRILTLINGSPSYGVQVIDKPTLSGSRAWPRRSIIFGLGLLTGAILGFMLHWLWFSRRWF